MAECVGRNTSNLHALIHELEGHFVPVSRITCTLEFTAFVYFLFKCLFVSSFKVKYQPACGLMLRAQMMVFMMMCKMLQFQERVRDMFMTVLSFTWSLNEPKSVLMVSHGIPDAFNASYF